MIGIPLGLLYANAGEWLIHKHLLHGAGRKKGSFFRFHWMEHHRECRLREMRDSDYERSVFGFHAQGKEALCLVAVAAAHLPLFPVAPFFTGTVLYSVANYYRVHKRAHLDPEWAKTHLPWHYDHHMAPDQDANWGVTRPWSDWVMGTRKPWLGTAEQHADEARKAARRAARGAGSAASGAESSASLEHGDAPIEGSVAPAT